MYIDCPGKNGTKFQVYENVIDGKCEKSFISIKYKNLYRSVFLKEYKIHHSLVCRLANFTNEKHIKPRIIYKTM